MFDFKKVSEEVQKKMRQSIDAMVSDFSTYRTGRASPVVLQRVLVNYYGSDVPVSQLATINVPEPRQLLITPYDKGTLPAIEKAIVKAELGLNPLNDGNHIRLNFPQMTEDRRKELTKQVHQRAEQACVGVRNARREGIEQIRSAHKNKELTEDFMKDHEDDIQKITDKYIAEVHDLEKKKNNELMEV